MIPFHSKQQRGRGLLSSAALVSVLVVVASVGACGGDKPVAERQIVARASDPSDSCTTMPDTLREGALAQLERNDLPDTRLVLNASCPRMTVLTAGAARLPRAFRVNVPAGHQLVARARSEFGGLVLDIDGPASPIEGFANVSPTAWDSVRVGHAGEVTVRVTYAPKVRKDPRVSRILLTVLVRP